MAKKEIERIVVLNRQEYSEEEVIGVARVYVDREHKFSCATLEQPWNDNKRNISCIPKGEYQVVPYSSKRYPGTYQILDVPNRKYILIHWGNYYFNTEGCILVGAAIADINGDGINDIVHSKETLKLFKKKLKYKPFKLIIK